MYILGFNCFMDDSSACLLKDGHVVLAIEEERLTRKKHTGEFPINAILLCLEEGGIGVEDLDHVAFNIQPLHDFHRRLGSIAMGLPQSVLFASELGPSWFSMLFAKRTFKQLIGAGRYRFHYVQHHMSHAALGFFASPFDEAAILSIDGSGESACTVLARGRGNQVEPIDSIHFPQSLGYFYMAFTQYLGFKKNSGEGKVMGLASYGEPEFAPRFRDIAVERSNGRYALDLSYFRHHKGEMTFYSDKVLETFGHEPREPESELSSFHENCAASLQARLEELCFHLMRDLRSRTGLRNLCLVGGVALNCSMNGKILANTDFDALYVPAAASDSGGGLGAALYVYHQLLGHPRREPLLRATLGPSYDDDRIASAVGDRYESSVVDPAECAADLLAAGKAIGWFQGRSELGPRALGCRSIIADPRQRAMVDHINQSVKFREHFRPFAPSVLEDRASDYFDGYVQSPFMLRTFMASAQHAEDIPAVIHVDGTARAQGVTQETNPLYYSLIEKFSAKTGIPVILNTSFNTRGEPLVETPEDALATFERSGLTDLVIGNRHVRKQTADPRADRGAGDSTVSYARRSSPSSASATSLAALAAHRRR